MTNPPVRYLVLWLTTACNLRCHYCYRHPEAPNAMPREIALAALSLAAAPGLPFHVQPAGGEPTLQPGLIEFVGRTVREAGWPATVAVQTNGTLIDAALIDLCRRYDIGMGISIDGPPTSRNSCAGGRATFSGIALLAQAAISVRVTAVLSSVNAVRLYDLPVYPRPGSQMSAGWVSIPLSGRRSPENARSVSFPGDTIRSGCSCHVRGGGTDE